MDAADAVARDYVALALRLGRLVPALVDAAAVPPDLRRTVAAEPVPTVAALVREAGRLAAAVPDAGLAPGRERFLAGQVHAVEWQARRLAGQDVPFLREVRECLDVDVVAGEPDVYRAAHRELAVLLPGGASLGGALAAHRRRDAVTPERLGPAVTALTAALRKRVAAPYGLAPDEAVEHCLVDGAPWRALQTYRGGGRSVVRVNAAAGLGAGRLPRLVAHETYPGHHTECCHAERAAARGRVELAVTVLGTPQTVVSEGMAECGLDVAVGPRWGRWAAAVLADVGVRIDGEPSERLDAVLGALRRVRLDAAVLLHEDGEPDAAQAHLRRWLLLDARRASRLVDALAQPRRRIQVAAVVEGTALVGNRLRGADPVTEHRCLLDDPPLPSALRRRTSTERVITYDGR